MENSKNIVVKFTQIYLSLAKRLTRKPSALRRYVETVKTSFEFNPTTGMFPH